MIERCNRCKTPLNEEHSEYQDLSCKDSCLSRLGDAVPLCDECGKGALAAMTAYLDSGCPIEWQCGCRERRERIGFAFDRNQERKPAERKDSYWQELMDKLHDQIVACKHPHHDKSSDPEFE